MSEIEKAQIYRKEIADYLIGRLSKYHSNLDLSASRSLVDSVPIRQWWILEGKKYSLLNGSLVDNWPEVLRQASLLLATFNPNWRGVYIPEGEVDWVATALRSLTSNQPEFVCNTSHIGLSRQERGALLGWLGWIQEFYRDYLSKLGRLDEVKPGFEVTSLQAENRADNAQSDLVRWAHVTKRSRWPLMRTVVAESLEALLEPVDASRLPLPDSYESLFELICVVRVLKSLAPRPSAIQWLDNFGGDNTCRIPGVEARIQRHFRREVLLNSAYLPPELLQVIDAQNISLPERADGVIIFEREIAGFDGILIEAKSGNQTPRNAILQLLCYSEALKKEKPGRYLVWGIIENCSDVDLKAKDMLSQPIPQDGNYWVFTTENEIGEVMIKLGLAAKENKAKDSDLETKEAHLEV